MFSISGLRLYFPVLELWVIWSVAGSGSCSFACPSPQSTASLGPPATTLPRVLSIRLPISAPPTGMDEGVFFISLVVGLPYSSIFCQFWLFFVSKLLLSFFWLCEEAQCVYLRLRLGRKSKFVVICYSSHRKVVHRGREKRRYQGYPYTLRPEDWMN